MTVQVLYKYRCVQVLKANQMVLLRFFYPLNVVFVLSFYFNRYCKNKINTFEVVCVDNVIFIEAKRGKQEFLNFPRENVTEVKFRYRIKCVITPHSQALSSSGTLKRTKKRAGPLEGGTASYFPTKCRKIARLYDLVSLEKEQNIKNYQITR